eukprot:TRINITY_DN3817_c0_g2_i3.p1 TRINITY_DN3817_c0_g2~~TRINITY_DN3817_c0_g2_i3.p1  ORF type:complete len:871 (+),score=123.32 TRINITY_DN3817_c0_g2_i3:39-2615(+)
MNIFVGLLAGLVCIFLLREVHATSRSCSASGKDGECSAGSRSKRGRQQETPRPPRSPELRFGVGDAVLVQMGRKDWRVAQVVRLNHRETSWPAGQVAPYMVELRDGGMAYVPSDDPRLIREAKEDDIARMRRADKITRELARESEHLKGAQLAAAQSLQHVRPDLFAVLQYHAESCHVRPGLYANGGSMDWENQPDKFRRIIGSKSVDLPRSGVLTLLSDDVAFGSLDALGVLLHDAAGITAWKSQGQQVKYSLRANPSSGALQPLEIYVFGDVGDHPSSHWHYNPYWHSLERVARLPLERWTATLKQLPQGAILVGLTSIVWRNAWKYGDPGFRYTHHDVGHQISSFAFAAAAQNASVVLLDSLTDEEITSFMRPDEPEEAVCILAIFPSSASTPEGNWWRDFALGENFWDGMGPPQHHGAPVEVYYGKPEVDARPIIAAARSASLRRTRPTASFWTGGPPTSELPAAWTSAGPLRPLIHQRRSAQNYNPDAAPNGGLPSALFHDILRRVLHQPVWFPWRAAVQPFLFVHRVEGLEPGIYLLCRGRTCEELRADVDPLGQFEWRTAPGTPLDVPLVLLRGRSLRIASLPVLRRHPFFGRKMAPLDWRAVSDAASACALQTTATQGAKAKTKTKRSSCRAGKRGMPRRPSVCLSQPSAAAEGRETEGDDAAAPQKRGSAADAGNGSAAAPEQQQQQQQPEQQRVAMLSGLPLVTRLSAVLERMAEQSGSEGVQPTPFHSQAKPPGTFLDYMKRLYQYFQCTDECFIIALAYIDRIGRASPELMVSTFSFHRLMLTSLMLAVKYHDDVYYSNRYYAKVGGVTLQEMNRLEAAFLTRLSFSMHITADHYNRYQALIVGLP